MRSDDEDNDKDTVKLYEHTLSACRCHSTWRGAGPEHQATPARIPQAPSRHRCHLQTQSPHLPLHFWNISKPYILVG